ncbi:hypothetical protein DNTS_008220 [Danionella cerebrum]|uniref:Alpha-carbonic anhydrase domain-containing protein n=1 Tax=Danionella cerebrum TaxID=2873325 RepID=A0A553R5M7_9TELE|nr:hypothetical protein DNTS_008220 [Danionella translucida]
MDGWVGGWIEVRIGGWVIGCMDGIGLDATEWSDGSNWMYGSMGGWLRLVDVGDGWTEKETFLEPFVLRELLPSSIGSYYRYMGSLTTPPCSKVVEWIIFSRPVFLSYKQLEAFYSIFTTEQQDHVKSVEYLRNNFRPLQSLDNREVFKSAIKDAWLPDLTDSLGNPYGTEASKG